MGRFGGVVESRGLSRLSFSLTSHDRLPHFLYLTPPPLPPFLVSFSLKSHPLPHVVLPCYSLAVSCIFLLIPKVKWPSLLYPIHKRKAQAFILQLA